MYQCSSDASDLSGLDVTSWPLPSQLHMWCGRCWLFVCLKLTASLVSFFLLLAGQSPQAEVARLNKLQQVTSGV